MESVKFDYSNALKFVDEKTIKEYDKDATAALRQLDLNLRLLL